MKMRLGFRGPGSPPLPRKLVRFSCAARQGGAAAQLAHLLHAAHDIGRVILGGNAVVHEARPVLADDPPPWLRLLGGEQGPPK